MDSAVAGFVGSTTASLAKVALTPSGPLHSRLAELCAAADVCGCDGVTDAARGTAVALIAVMNVFVLKKSLDGMKVREEPGI